MTDYEKKYQLAKSRAARLKKSARASEELLEQRSKALYLANQKLEAAQEHLQQEVKQATYELNVANQRLRKSLKDKSHLIGAISHEIRTPLNAIVGYSELVESKLQAGEIKDQVNIISQSAVSMMSLLNDILEVTQIEVGNMESHPSSVNLEENLSFVEQLFQLQMQNKGLQWRISSDNLPDVIRIDVRRYNQIINNLVSNALKYTSSGFVNLHCWYDQDQDNPKHGVLYSCVEDSGQGISEQDQRIIFDLYQHMPKQETISGQFDERQQEDDVVLHSLGLGLPICHALSQLMLGHISCESELGIGSKFTVALPVNVVQEGRIENKPEVVNNGKQKAPLKILIAEDTLLNQQLLKAQLAQLEQSAEIVDNGLLALNKLTKNDYDLVVLDILMPVMDGETTIKKIRSSEQRIANHYCAALTAASYQEKGEHLLGMGFDEFLSKPLNLSSLKNIIDSTYIRLHGGQDQSLDGVNNVDDDFDFKYFIEQFGDDAKTIFLKIAPTYIEQSQLNQEKLNNALRVENLQTIKFIAHAMKGEARTFGFDSLSFCCEQLETCTEISQAADLIEQVSKELKPVLQTLEIQVLKLQ